MAHRRHKAVHIGMVFERTSLASFVLGRHAKGSRMARAAASNKLKKIVQFDCICCIEYCRAIAHSTTTHVVLPAEGSRTGFNSPGPPNRKRPSFRGWSFFYLQVWGVLRVKETFAKNTSQSFHSPQSISFQDPDLFLAVTQ